MSQKVVAGVCAVAGLYLVATLVRPDPSGLEQRVVQLEGLVQLQSEELARSRVARAAPAGDIASLGQPAAVAAATPQAAGEAGAAGGAVTPAQLAGVGGAASASAAGAAGPPRWTDSGRLVFIDLGANCGNSYKRLVNKKMINGPKWEAFLWEANPQMVKWYLTDLAKADPKVRVVPLAAWTENKKMQFFLTRGQEDVTDIKQFKAHKCRAGSHYQPSGASSLFSGMGTGGEFDVGRKRNIYRPGKAVEVDAVDFAEWIRDQELKRDDRVVLKIDIEGAEIPLLRHMLKQQDKVACMVDHYFVEWHSWMLSNKSAQAEIKEFEDGFVGLVEQHCGEAPVFGDWH